MFDPGWLKLVVVVVAAAACVRTDSVPCGDGVCAAGTECVVVAGTAQPLHLCVAQPAACTGAGACDYHGGAGTCHLDTQRDRWLCLPNACGNQLLDDGEACDDGNTLAGDGCSAACVSNEACGNSHVDPAQGETCDDGNSLGRDGCSPSCVEENPRWELVFEGRPAPRRFGAAAYDASRRRIVMFGGLSSVPQNTVLSDTIEWDGARWSRPQPNIAPLPRVGHAMAYDASRRVVVLFGGGPSGAGADPDHGDTWEWNGATWTQKGAVVVPPPRSNHAMAYDARRKRVVLFGGERGNEYLDDTWEWDGTTWTAVTSTTTPAARSSHAMAYDAKRGRIVLFGGGTTRRDGMRFDDTFELTDTGWTAMAPATRPPARDLHAMAFDAVTQQVLLIGGSGSAVFDDAWHWTGTAWVAAATLPAPLRGHVVASDPHRGRIAVFATPDGAGLLEWNGTAWISLDDDDEGAGPPPRFDAAIAADPLRRRILMFGGIAVEPGPVQVLHDDGWAWNGAWTRLSGTGPTARYGAALAYHAARDLAVMFGGRTMTAAPLAETWIHADTWSAGTTAPALEGLIGHTMTYDTVRRQIVLFGGGRSVVQVRDETWLWDGAWIQATPATSPPPRAHAAAAYDPVRNYVVVVGGAAANNEPLADAWAWDGTSWFDVTPREATLAPSPRSSAALAWDPARQRLVLFGGRIASNAAAQDTWEATWATRADSTLELRWHQLDVADQPLGRSDHALVSAIDQGGVMLVGGVSLVGADVMEHGELARLEWGAATSYEQCTDTDTDGDGDAGCVDDDCWATCSPLCPPGATSCPAGPTCGDGTCRPLGESCVTCPEDCDPCPQVCGDFVCGAGEDAATCVGDCP